MAADVHHLYDGEFVGEIHIGNATASGGVGSYAIVARHHHIPFVVALYRQFPGFLLFLLLHSEFCRYLDRKCRHLLGKVFQYLLYVTVQNLVNHRGEIILVFFADGFEVGIHYWNLDLVAGLLLDKADNRCSFCSCSEVFRLDVVVVRMNINIPDERGVVISPREWFHVSIEAVNEAVDKILNDTIGDYVYDPRLKTVIAKSATREAHETPLSDSDVYNKVLQEISYFGQSIEKKSALYQGKDEESLRDLFLTNLERRFDGITATGETFNFNGKTDILLKRAEDSSNVFIGECKIWKGQKKFLEAINQLFDRYLTVRDKRAALIFFVKSGSYSTVLKTIRENVGKHPYYKASENEEGDALYRYLFRLPDDMDANIELAIMAFNYQDKI